MSSQGMIDSELWQHSQNTCRSSGSQGKPAIQIVSAFTFMYYFAHGRGIPDPLASVCRKGKWKVNPRVRDSLQVAITLFISLRLIAPSLTICIWGLVNAISHIVFRRSTGSFWNLANLLSELLKRANSVLREALSFISCETSSRRLSIEATSEASTLAGIAALWSRSTMFCGTAVLARYRLKAFRGLETSYRLIEACEIQVSR
ncbi:hypothetical protein B0J14DRAFT_580210 [Halenospora varia]|nr:hypothetical protein B0J14DRAFT_580210 [Halenospora varia]